MMLSGWLVSAHTYTIDKDINIIQFHRLTWAQEDESAGYRNTIDSRHYLATVKLVCLNNSKQCQWIWPTVTPDGDLWQIGNKSKSTNSSSINSLEFHTLISLR